MEKSEAYVHLPFSMARSNGVILVVQGRRTSRFIATLIQKDDFGTSSPTVI